MRSIQECRATVQDIWDRRHYFPEQSFDAIYMEALNELKRAEARDHALKAEYHERMARRYLSEIEGENP